MEIEETLAEKMDRRLLRWFGYIERIDEGRWPRNVKAAAAQSHQKKERPRFEWLNRVERAYAVLQDERISQDRGVCEENL